MNYLKRNQPGFLDRKELAKQERRLAAQQRDRIDVGTVDGSVSDDNGEEVPEKLRAFHARNRAEQERRRNATDSERWLCVAFPTRADKDAFVAEFGVIDKPMIPGTPGNKYVDGNALGRALRAMIIRRT